MLAKTGLIGMVGKSERGPAAIESIRKHGAVYCIAVGTNGTDASSDLGKQWQRISDEGFHAVEFTPDSAHGWACGSDGRIAKWLGVSSAEK